MSEPATTRPSIGRAVRRVIAGLYDEVAELRLGSARSPQCAMTALAVAIATAVALELRVDAPWWAAISAFVSVRTTAPASVQRGALRIIGTAIGAAFALWLSPWLIEDQVALSLVLLAVGTLGVLGLQVSNHGYAWLLGAVTTVMVLLAALGDPHSTLDIACNRTAEVTIGTLAAILVALVLAPTAETVLSASAAPGWSNVLDAQWPSLEHALRAGVAVMLVPLVWRWLELPNLSQTAVTAAAVMAVPALSNDDAANRQMITERALHRLIGCLLGGVAGLACLMLSIETFLPWLAMLTVGIWIAAHVQGSQRGIGYVGTQGAVVFISTLVQGWGPPASIFPGLDRFAGITGGLLILLTVSWLTAPSTVPVRVDRIRTGMIG
jgi:uncharacterized membrane protein YccC